MITTEIYKGQGLGNQLWSIAACQAIARRCDTNFSILGRERFKGSAFLAPDFGVSLEGARHRGPCADLPYGISHYFKERSELLTQSGRDVTRFDTRVAHIQKNTKIDGYFQSELYLLGLRASLTKQFRSRFFSPLDDDICVVNFRGGEYRDLNDVLLPPSYYHSAMEHMQLVRGPLRFMVVTDDRSLARKYFGDIPIVSHRRVPYIRRIAKTPTSKRIGQDFSLVQAAKNLIISNSSFSWWAAWTNPQNPVVIAPKYWALHNTSNGFWSQGDSLTSGWQWLDRDGIVWSYEQCQRERESIEPQYHSEVSEAT